MTAVMLDQQNRVPQPAVVLEPVQQTIVLLNPRKPKNCDCAAIIKRTGQAIGNARDSISIIHKIWKVIGSAAIIANVVLKRDGWVNLSNKLESAVDYAEIVQGLDNADHLFARRTIRNEDGTPKLDDKGQPIKKTKFQQLWFDYEKNKVKLPFAGLFRVSLISADIGGLAFWGESMGFYDMSNWATKITEKFSGFATVAKIGLGNIIKGIVGFAFAFFAIDSTIRLVQSVKDKDQVKITKSALELAWSVTEVALKVFLLAGCATLIGGTLGVIATAGLGILAAGMGVASGIYNYIQGRKQSEEEEKELKQKRKQALEAEEAQIRALRDNLPENAPV